MAAATAMMSGRWTRVRTLGRGASGAEVFLAADATSGQLFAVKEAAGAAAAAALRRERGVMGGLSSPHVVPCIGGRAGRGGGSSYQLFLEFAPGGSLADAAARAGGGRLDERAVRRYAADVARGLEYLHGVGLVHGDVKPRNVVIGADGRAMLADFGCARPAGSSATALPIGGTPAFMAPEVARGEEQGPAADVWALGCTVLELATGRAPWSGMEDALAAMRRIGYTEAVPEVPVWLSAETTDFLAMCLKRRPGDRCTAAQLLEHPFLALTGCDAKAEAPKSSKWVSPKSTLDAAFWESDADEEEEEDDEPSQSTTERIRALACPASALPDWDSDEGWINVIATPSDVAVPAVETAATHPDDDGASSEDQSSETEAADPLPAIDVDNAGEAGASPEEEFDRHSTPNSNLVSHDVLCKKSNSINAVDFVSVQTNIALLLSLLVSSFPCLCY